MILPCPLSEEIIVAKIDKTRNNQKSVKLPKVKLETGRKGFYFLAAKMFNALPPEVRSVEYRTMFRKALEEHCQ